MDAPVSLRKRKKDETHRRFLEAARTLFATRGLDQVSVDDIIEAAGSSKGAFYYHFRSKDELVLAIVEAHTEAQLEAITDCLAGTRGGQLADVCESTVQLIFRADDDPTLLRLFMQFWLYAGRNRRAKARIALLYARWRERLAELLRRGIQNGLVREDTDPVIAAATLIAIHDGLLLQASVDPESLPLAHIGEPIGRMLVGWMSPTSHQ